MYSVNDCFNRYEAGDHVAIYPQNDPEQVEAIGHILGVDLDEVFALQNVDGMLLRFTWSNNVFFCRGQLQEVSLSLSDDVPHWLVQIKRADLKMLI